MQQFPESSHLKSSLCSALYGILLGLAFFPTGVWAKDAKAKHLGSKTIFKVLEFPPQSQSLEALSREVTGVFLGETAGCEGGTVWLATGRQPLVLNAPFFGLAAASGEKADTGREKVFGKLTDMHRTQLPPAFGASSSWRGIMIAKDGDEKPKLLLLDGDGLSFALFDSATGESLQVRQIPWDLIKPPADRGGEPTSPETARLRVLFKKQLTPVKLKVTGAAIMPKSLSGKTGDDRSMLLATRIPGFPLLMASCTEESMTQCVIARRCNLEGVKDLSAGAVSGIGVSAKRNLILIGDRESQRILGFRFDSCYNVQKVAEWSLPDRLKKISNVFIDSSDRLWITTSEPDDYLNANVYVWKATEW